MINLQGCFSSFLGSHLNPLLTKVTKLLKASSLIILENIYKPLLSNFHSFLKKFCDSILYFTKLNSREKVTSI